MNSRTLAALAAVALLAGGSISAVYGEDAATTFKSRCSPCHGVDGSGNTPMGKKIGAKALGSADVQKQSDADLQKAITNGKARMPSFAGKLTPEQITALVKLIRTFAPK